MNYCFVEYVKKIQVKSMITIIIFLNKHLRLIKLNNKKNNISNIFTFYIVNRKISIEISQIKYI